MVLLATIEDTKKKSMYMAEMFIHQFITSFGYVHKPPNFKNTKRKMETVAVF